MAPELRRLRSWRSHSVPNLNGDTEGSVFQGRRMNLRSRKGAKKDMMNASASEGSDDQTNVGPQLRSGRKKVVSDCARCALLFFVGVRSGGLRMEEMEEGVLCGNHSQSMCTQFQNTNVVLDP